jgi:hypothetical protein
VAEGFDADGVVFEVESPPASGGVPNNGGDATSGVGGGEELGGLVWGVGGGVEDDDRVPGVPGGAGEPPVERCRRRR